MYLLTFKLKCAIGELKPLLYYYFRNVELSIGVLQPLRGQTCNIFAWYDAIQKFQLFSVNLFISEMMLVTKYSTPINDGTKFIDGKT